MLGRDWGEHYLLAILLPIPDQQCALSTPHVQGALQLGLRPFCPLIALSNT